MQILVDSSRWKPVEHAHWYLIAAVVSNDTETHFSFGPQSVPLMLHSGPSDKGVTEGVTEAGMPVGETVFSADGTKVCVTTDVGEDEFDKDSRRRTDTTAKLNNN